MRAHQAVYPVQTMCRVLEVSRSGYYAWRRREPAARALASWPSRVGEPARKEPPLTPGPGRIVAAARRGRVPRQARTRTWAAAANDIERDTPGQVARGENTSHCTLTKFTWRLYCVPCQLFMEALAWPQTTSSESLKSLI